MAENWNRLTTIGHNMGKGLMPDEMTDFCLNYLSGGLGMYEDDLGNGVKRRIRIIEINEDSIEVEVRLTGYREAEHHYNIHLRIESLET